MKWIFWLFVSNAGIFWLEYVYRSARYGGFFESLPYITLPVLVSQMGLFYCFRDAPSLFFAGAVFTLSNVILRIVNTYLLGEHLSPINWFGVALLVIATVLIKLK